MPLTDPQRSNLITLGKTVTNEFTKILKALENYDYNENQGKAVQDLLDTLTKIMEYHNQLESELSNVKKDEINEAFSAISREANAVNNAFQGYNEEVRKIIQQATANIVLNMARQQTILAEAFQHIVDKPLATESVSGAKNEVVSSVVTSAPMDDGDDASLVVAPNPANSSTSNRDVGRELGASTAKLIANKMAGAAVSKPLIPPQLERDKREVVQRILRGDTQDLDEVLKRREGENSSLLNKYKEIVMGFKHGLKSSDLGINDKADAVASWVIANDKLDAFKARAKNELEKAMKDLEQYDDQLKGGFNYFNQEYEKMNRERRVKAIANIEELIVKLEKDHILKTKLLGGSDWNAEQAKDFDEKLSRAETVLKKSDLQHSLMPDAQPQNQEFLISSRLARQLRKKGVMEASSYCETFSDYMEYSDKSIQAIRKSFTPGITTGKETDAIREEERERLYKGVRFNIEPSYPGKFEARLPDGGLVTRQYDINNKKTVISVVPPADKNILIMLDTSQAYKTIMLNIPKVAVPGGKPGEKTFATIDQLNENDMRSVLKIMAASKLRGDRPPIEINEKYAEMLANKFPTTEASPGFAECYQQIKSISPDALKEIISPRGADGKRQQTQFSLDRLVDAITKQKPLALDSAVELEVEKQTPNSPK